MFSAKDRKCFISSETTVEDLINVLRTYDTNATVGVAGNSIFFIHVKEDGTAISFDSSLDETYIEQGNYNELPEVIFESY